MSLARLNLRTVLAPEAELVLRTAGGADQDDRVRALLGRPLNWAMVIQLAVQQRAVPVFFRRLRAVDPGSIPSEATATLDQLSQVTEFRQRHLQGQLAEVVARLAGEGIQVVCLKGAATGLLFAGHLLDRPMADLDLLVRPQDVGRAEALLIAAGWRSTATAANARFYGSHQHRAPLLDGQVNDLRLELHADLFFSGHPFALSPQDVFAGARAIGLQGETLLAPSDAHLFLHLCLHFAWSHMVRQGAWRTFRDLHVLEAAHAVDWAQVPALARTARAATCCYWTLRLARAYTGLAVPDTVLEALRPSHAEPILAALERHFATNLLPSRAECPSARLSRYLWSMAIEPARSRHGPVRPWARAALVRQAFLPEPALPGSRKVVVHLRNARTWGRYVAAVLFPAGRASPPPTRTASSP